MDAIIELHNQYPGLSITDCSVLELSVSNAAALLTSDKALRNVATSLGVECKGLIGVIEDLVTIEELSHKLAIEKLELYKQINLRAPQKETEDLKRRILNQPKPNSYA